MKFAISTTIIGILVLGVFLLMAKDYSKNHNSSQFSRTVDFATLNRSETISAGTPLTKDLDEPSSTKASAPEKTEHQASDQALAVSSDNDEDDESDEPPADYLSQAALTRPLDQGEIAGLDITLLRLIRNGMFARNGYRVHDPELRDYFNSRPWYKPTNVSIESISRTFTEQQQANLRLIIAQEKKAENPASVQNSSSSQSSQRSSSARTSCLTPPFTPEGSSLLVGRWGRNANIIIHGGQEAAQAHYSEYVFYSDGHFSYKGHFFSEPESNEGKYRLDGKTLRLYYTDAYVNGRSYPPADPGPVEVEVDDPDGFPTFQIGIAMFQKGIWWDFKRGCYIDPNGNPWRALNH